MILSDAVTVSQQRLGKGVAQLGSARMNEVKFNMLNLSLRVGVDHG
jgi:hypothetical protein